MAKPENSTQPYELLEHTADIRIRVRARDLPSLFERAGYALFDLVSDVSSIRGTEKRSISVRASDLEELLVSWLGELLYQFEVNGLLFSTFSVLSLDDQSLSAEVQGEAYDSARHLLKADIKAVTYHQLEIVQAGGEWQAAIVFDI